jgi:hypothetical protein
MRRLVISFVLLSVAWLFVLGICVKGIYGFSVNKTIDLLALTELAVTIFVAVFLQHFLSITLSDKRVEKNLIIQEGESAVITLKSCWNVLVTCHDSGVIAPDSARRINTLMKRLSSDLATLEETISLSSCRRFTKNCVGIREHFFQFKVASTGTPFPSRPYTLAARSHQGRLFRALQTDLKKLILTINSH